MHAVRDMLDMEKENSFNAIANSYEDELGQISLCRIN